MSAMCSRTLTRKTSLLRKIGPIARRSSFATKIVLQLAHLTHLAMSCDARAPKTIWRLGMVPANCFAGSKLGSISSLRCQKTRILLSIQTSRMRSDVSRTTVPDLGNQTIWWSQTGSNRRPHACKARALPAELWPRTRRRMLTLSPPSPFGLCRAHFASSATWPRHA